MKASGVFLVFLIIITLCVVNTQPVRATEDSWTPKTPMPTARSGLGVAVVNGKIYAIGGINQNGFLATCEEYNPVTDTWVTKTPMPTPRAHFAIAAYQNKVYVIAGEERSGDPSWANEVFDPLTDTWETKATVPFETGREYMSANVVNGKIYVISGLASLWPPYPSSNENYVYDPATDTWTTRAPIPRPVHGYASAAVGNKIYIIGGRDFYSSPSILNLTQIYDTVTDTWSYGASMPTAAHYVIGGLIAGVSTPQRIFVLGGFTSSGPPAPKWLNLTRVYDPERDEWTTGTPMLTPRSRAGAAVVNDALYVIGGKDAASNFRHDNEQYTPFSSIPVPAVSIVSPENKTYAVADVPLTFTVSEPASWMAYSLDAQATVTITGNTTLTSVPDGSHTIRIYARGASGNLGSSSTVYFSVDTAPPTIAILSPENGVHNATTILLSLKVNEPLSWLAYSLDGQAEVIITENATFFQSLHEGFFYYSYELTGLSLGSHSLTVYATDFAGNTGASATVYFSIKTQQSEPSPSEPFPTTWIIAATAIIAIGVAIILGVAVYIRKRLTSHKPP